MSNPLLSTNHLPSFNDIKAEHFVPAVESVIAEANKTIESLVNSAAPTWNELISPLEDLQNRVHHVWSPARHLNSVMNTDDIQAAHDACLPLISNFYTELGQHSGLCDKVKALAESEEFHQLTATQQRVVTNHLKDFTLSGIALPAEKKAEFKATQSELSQLSSQFANNVLNATKAWVKHLEDETLLDGIPNNAVALFKQQAESRDLAGWVITLDFPSYLPVMTYATNRELREELYHAFVTRASELGPNANEFNNADNMQQILSKRHKNAQLLGFNNYAELSIDRKMATTTDGVITFLNELAEKSVATAKAEYAELVQFANELDGLNDLQPWDSTYYSEKLKQQTFAISDEELKPYFPIDRVISGLFSVAKQLFNVDIIEHDGAIAKWHEQVQFFDVRDADGSLRGQFYLDPFARTGKRGGAWMDDAVVRTLDTESGIVTPVAYLVCNFTPPVGDEPSCLTHREIETLFHEFGHGIHHMLTKETSYSISGINGVEWDAVELPSQFMENWCWHYESLKQFAKHVDTDNVIPESLVNKLRASQHFQAGMQMVRQLEFSLFDFLIHKEFSADKPLDVMQILADVRKSVAVTPTTAYNRFPNSFSHIFSGGYAAGYYSYKWAEVLSADAFEEFEKHGVFNAEIGMKFSNEVLEKGGSRPALESFVAFKGREPQITALLKQYGLAA